MSTEVNGTFKPDPRAYELGMMRLHLLKDEIAAPSNFFFLVKPRQEKSSWPIVSCERRGRAPALEAVTLVAPGVCRLRVELYAQKSTGRSDIVESGETRICNLCRDIQHDLVED